MGCFVGFAEAIGNPVTFLMLNPATNKLVGRSRMTIAKCHPNLRADQEAGLQPGDSSKEPLRMTDKTMQDCLTAADLQKCIYANQAEMDRLRQLVVNLIIATDIFDPKLKESRERRWEEAFGVSPSQTTYSDDQWHNLRGTVMLEHIIQASDVAHTMQHWQIYRKWNERLFEEMMLAYDANRASPSSKDPATGSL